MKFELKFLREVFVCNQYKLIYELYFLLDAGINSLITQGTLQYIREYVLSHCKNAITVAQMIELNDLITKEEGKEDEIKQVLTGCGTDNEKVFVEFSEQEKAVEKYELTGFSSLHFDWIPPHPNKKENDFIKYI